MENCSVVERNAMLSDSAGGILPVLGSGGEADEVGDSDRGFVWKQSTGQLSYGGFDDGGGCARRHGELAAWLAAGLAAGAAWVLDCAQTARADIENSAKTKKALRISAPCTRRNVHRGLPTFDCNVRL